MGLGIKREMIGDIIINEDKAQFFCHNSISEFVEFNLKKVGRYNAEIRESESYEVPVLKTQDISINVSSMRLDSISAECFGLSRTKSAEFITKGAVSLNWLVCTDTSKEVKAGDKISMRGKGKAEVVGISGKSRKGRLFVDVKNIFKIKTSLICKNKRSFYNLDTYNIKLSCYISTVIVTIFIYNYLNSMTPEHISIIIK